MTEIFPWGSLGAISKEEDLKLSRRFQINPPPEDGCCDVCGRHMSELTPFGGPGDPLLGDFSGELLVKIWRRMGPYDEKAHKAWQEAEAQTGAIGLDEVLPWLITKYGKERAEKISLLVEAWDQTGASWECRDCIILDDDEYFEKLNQRYQERRNK
jgi:hypothetical protein